VVASVKRFGEYLGVLGDLVAESSLGDDPVITQVTYDSREVVPGALFICKGVHFSPDYLRQAVERGAVAYISLEPYPEITSIPYALVSDMRATIASAGTLFYDREWDALTILGITGTKGKSTTVMYLHSILSAWAKSTGGPRPGILSTIINYDGVIEAPSVKTTAETLDLYKHLHNAVTTGLTEVCMEVSSQGLRYRRVANVEFDVAGWLNIVEDHISPAEHKDMEDYLSAKLMLFSQSRHAVVNIRTQELDRVMAAAAACESLTTFGLQRADDPIEADFLGSQVRPTPTGQDFTVTADGTDHRLFLPMPGTFNVENALAAIAMARNIDVPWDSIAAGLADVHVPGRMDAFRLASGALAIVDYAHQKLSIETLLDYIHTDYPTSAITMVFGCGGQKALNRREELGILAREHADTIVLTEEDPGDVAVIDICEEIDRHIQAGGPRPSHIIVDRVEAINYALEHARDGDVVLILGKGDEPWQLRGATQVPQPSDIDVVNDFLARESG